MISSERRGTPPRVMLLVIALALGFSPFTSWRVNSIGASELLLLLLWISQLGYSVRWRIFRELRVTHFWLFFCAISAIGALVNQIFLRYPSGTAEQIGFDAAAYGVVLIGVMAVETALIRWPATPRRALELATAIGSVTIGFLSILYFTSGSGRTPPISDEWGHFAPFATNLHHTAMYVLPLPFVALAAGGWSEGRRRYRWTALVAAPLLLLAAIATGAEKPVIALVVGAGVVLLVAAGHRLGAGGWVGVSGALVAVVLAIQTQVDLVALSIRAFTAVDRSGARTFLYSEGIKVGLESPLVGRGPGAHLQWDYAYLDAHQTILTVFLQSGVLGVAAFAAVVIWMAVRVRGEALLAGGIATIGVYALGGDVMRRPSIWIICLLIANAAGRAQVVRTTASRTAVDTAAMARIGKLSNLPGRLKRANQEVR